MDELLGFLFMIVVAIVSSISKSKKKKQQAQARKQVRQEIASKQQNRAPYSMEALQAWFEEEDDNQPAEKAWKPEDLEPAVAAATGMGEKTHEGLHPCDEHSSAPKQVVQPRVQPRVQVTEKPTAVLGSMGVDSHEGMHPCDTHGDAPLSADGEMVYGQAEQPGLRLDWSGENMVKAFVMQEILTRPAQRRRA